MGRIAVFILRGKDMIELSKKELSSVFFVLNLEK